MPQWRLQLLVGSICRVGLENDRNIVWKRFNVSLLRVDVVVDEGEGRHAPPRC
jgi:hypothetical protein